MSDPSKPLSDADLAMVVGGASAGGAPAVPDLSKLEVTSAADIHSVMAMFQQVAQEQRDAAREVRSAELDAQVNSLKGAAAEIREAAEDRFHQAVVAGSMQIVAGAMSMGAGLASLGASTAAIKQGLHGDDVTGGVPIKGGAAFGALGEPGPAQLSDGHFREILGAKQVHVDGLAQGLNGFAGSMSAGAQSSMAAQADAEKAELAAQAVRDMGTQHANELMSQMTDVIKDVREKLSSIQQSEADALRGVIRKV